MAMQEIRFYCPHCGQHLQGDESVRGQEVQCPFCSNAFKVERPTAQQPAAEYRAEPVKQSEEVKRLAAKLGENLSSLTGVEKLEGFKLSDLFSEVLRKHSSEEIEEYFTVGTLRTTPDISQVDTRWPRPWVFFRTFLGALIIYFLFLAGWDHFHNVNLIPGLIMVGSFAVPLATLIFFVEINARRNVSLYQVIRLLFLGGIVSLIVSLFFFQVSNNIGLGWLGHSLAGLAEEPGKLLALLTVAGLPRYRYKLNGLLFGAAVGTGFAAFESAGYALRFGLMDAQQMREVIMLRGMLPPFGHIAWTAMAGAALWRVKGADPFVFSMLADARFLRVFATAIVLHMLWNSPLDLPFYGKFAVLGAVAWLLLLGLIQEGLKELREEKKRQAAGE